MLVEGLGAKIAAESELDFVEKIHSLLINKEHRVALGLRGKEYALQQWSSAAQAEKMLALYARLIVRFHENIEKQLIGLESQQT